LGIIKSMNIYVDESGSFVSASSKGSWNVVVAVAAPEASRRAIEQAVRGLKQSLPKPLSEEIKLNALSEEQYLDFLHDLSKTHATLFATATDAGLNAHGLLVQHQQVQVGKVRENLSRMKFDGGRQCVKLLADQLETISPQLYAQLICQVDLLHDVVTRSINYFAQRIPATLAEFRWRIDQKNTSKTTYEAAFEKIAPALLQTRSFRQPGFLVEDFDYRHLKHYQYAAAEVPQYLEVEYGLRVENALNIQKLIRGNLKFEDSRSCLGIQIADLLASGLRRCLRGGFAANDAVADALGRLTVKNQRGIFPIHLISFGEETDADDVASRVVKSMTAHSKPMLAKQAH
jgi:hypothetical protein